MVFVFCVSQLFNVPVEVADVFRQPSELPKDVLHVCVVNSFDEVTKKKNAPNYM